MDAVHYITPETDEDAVRLEINRDTIRSFSCEDVLKAIDALEDKWGLSAVGDRFSPITNSFRQFYDEKELSDDGLPLDFNYPDLETLSHRHESNQNIFLNLLARIENHDMMKQICEDINGNEFTVLSRLNRVLLNEKDSYITVTAFVNAFVRTNYPTISQDTPARDKIADDCEPVDDPDELSKYQVLLGRLICKLSDMNLRRYGDNCCKQVVTKDHYHTKAWVPYMSIKEFVYDCAKRQYSPIWKLLTDKPSYAKDSVNYLSMCKDINFPEIVKNRNVWSFNNGLFCGKQLDIDTGKFTTKFYPYDSSTFSSIDPTVVSSKFFDLPFDSHEDKEDWRDIPTPAFQSIMDYQEFPADVCDIMYVMGGKLLYEVNAIERWQCIPFMKGIAGSGKSTIVKAFSKFYETLDVKTLSNNIERKFGLSSIMEGLMFIAPEVKGDLCLEQAEFQSIVSGESVSVACKFEKAKSITWKNPGILAGNEVPSYKDNSGSVLRRILTFNFTKMVDAKDKDTRLDDKIDNEIPALLLKCSRAYLDFAQAYPDKDIWSIVPDYFLKIQKQVAMVTNSLQHFLESEKIQYGDDLRIPQKMFVQMFNQHCQENNLGKQKFNSDFYAGPFSTRRIKVVVEAGSYKGKAYPRQPFIVGLDLVEDTLEFSEEY